MPQTIFWSILIASGLTFGANQYRKFLKKYRARMLEECKQGHLAIGSRIFHSYDSAHLEEYLGDIREWERTYTGKVERGIFCKLSDELHREWHQRYHLVKPRQTA